ncbi:phytanoyl-CoA dioxygenase family protein [Aquihabitans daechungensis]|uniref:phytanoyl-CoA dioxygenase family protein n=1 Tax=Aquihabitans daechungensis TaxID=1052257 RepID=UPI003BA03D3C
MTALPRTLLDDALEAELDRSGWVVVPLLEPDEVQELRAFYLGESAGGEHNPEGAYDPTYAEFSVIHSRPEFRARAFDIICRVVGGRAAPLLDRFRPIVANYVNKPPGTGVVPMHQNWTVVDEERFRSVSVWVALVDVTIGNGALEVLPRSHRALRTPRGMWAYEAFADAGPSIIDDLVPVEVRAGEAIILDDALVHYSAPNDSSEDRLAIQLIMVPEAAQARFYERVGRSDDGHVVAVWEVEEPFFWDFWHGAGDAAHGRIVERITMPDELLSPAELDARLRAAT